MTDELVPESGCEVEQLLRTAVAGDQAAAQELFDRHRDRLRRMISLRMDKRVAARFDPSDVLQEALMTANARLPAYWASQCGGSPYAPFSCHSAAWPTHRRIVI